MKKPLRSLKLKVETGFCFDRNTDFDLLAKMFRNPNFNSPNSPQRHPKK
jgi:hypothetical protein